MPDRDAEFQLKATDRTGPATTSAADGLEKVGDKADKAKRKIDDLGDEARHLSKKLLEARAAALALAREFDKTGDSKILKDFEKINREAAKLGQVTKTLKVKNPDGLFGDITKGARKAGLIAGDLAVEGIGDAFKGLGTASPMGSYLIAGLVGAAATAAPLIVAAAEGAVLAGIGAGGIGAGLILGARDPRVIHAYGDLGVRIMKTLEADAQPFTTQLLALPPKLGTAFDQEEPRIKRVFANLAPVFGDVADEAIGAVHDLMPSIEKAAIVGGQILRTIAPEFRALAGDVGDLLDAFSSSGQGAAAGLGILIGQLRVMVSLLAFGAQVSAPALNAFGKLAELGHIVPETSGNVKHLDEIQRGAGQSATLAAGGYNNLAFSLRNTADMAKQLQDNFDRLFSEQMNVDQANLAVNMGITQLTETIKANKGSLDAHTAAGQADIGMIQQQIRNLNQVREANIAAGNGTAAATEQANAAYASQLEGLRKLLYSLGLNHAEVDKLINAYAELAKPQTKVFTTVFKNEGTPYESRSTGSSRQGSAGTLSGLDGWAPARFAARTGFAETGSSSPAPHMPPVEVHSDNHFTVELDGRPFQARIVRAVSAAEKRQAWRAKVGAR